MNTPQEPSTSEVPAQVFVRPQAWALPLGSLLLALLALGILTPIDTVVSSWACQLSEPTRQIFTWTSKPGDSLYWLLGCAVVWLASLYSPKRIGAHVASAFIFAAVAVSGLLAIVLKIAFGRARPSWVHRHGGSGFHGWVAPQAHHLQSFPSGHTTTAFAVATAWALLAPKWRFPALAFACLVGVSRVGSTCHYPTDVVAGAALGAATSAILAPYFLGRLRKLEACPPPQEAK